MDAMSKIEENKTGEFIQKGCKCKRTACVKKYCRCYVNQVRCAWFCGCVGCRNHDEDILEQQGETESLIQNAELVVPDELEMADHSAEIEGAYNEEADNWDGADDSGNGDNNGDDACDADDGDPINLTDNVDEIGIDEASIDESVTSAEVSISYELTESEEEGEDVI